MARAPGWLLLSLLLLSLCSCVRSFIGREIRGDLQSIAEKFTNGWFQQTLDHFNNNYSMSWKQRYFINETFYKIGGPVFLMIEGQRAARREWITDNYAWVTYAERLGALCLYLEHRFYGQSQPIGGPSTDYPHYLSSLQVLADIVNFRIKMARGLGVTQNKWVVFGDSYAGSLAVWSRIKRPDLFAAAVASSAPFEAKMHFCDFWEVVNKILYTYSRKCPKAVQTAFVAIVEMLQRPESYHKLAKHYMLCEPLKINSTIERANFLEIMMGFLKTIILQNGTDKASKGKQNEISIDDFCDIMTNISLGSPYYRYAKISNLMVKNKGMLCLSSNYSDHLAVNKPTSDKHRLYQCCTEFGLQPHKRLFFGLSLRYLIKKCSEASTLKFKNSSVAWSVMKSSKYYGNPDVKGSKIIFVSGSDDPWRTVGTTKNMTGDADVVFIKAGTHCAAMLQPTDTDSSELTEAREKVFNILQKWLKE